ncbi:hypothetical protein [Asanoa sp. NPDC050611]|uniref:hypothetical protein n=1 Tax=Asanoa sp. NPDC050611 TaxID=3157098 RepID=UPI0033F9112D
MDTHADLADRYIAVWNEPDAQRRRALVGELWSADGTHQMHPPEEVRTVADRFGVTPRLTAHGHAELESRVTKAYEEFVAPGRYLFRPQDTGTRVHDALKFRWEMVDRSDGTVAAVGLEVLLLEPDGRIRMDYQFIEA